MHTDTPGLFFLPHDGASAPSDEFVVLQLRHTPALFAQLRALPTLPITDSVFHYAHERGTFEEHAAVRAGDLVTLAAHPDVLAHRRNQATWAYVQVLAPDTLIGLMWMEAPS